ncbi:MAG: hypothetical protein IH840_16875 [Candidatus Heimdallarchaeota archaeon]|nr:hypothetical protein [Candidatus Heimdallarchaeota archaeon]
MSKEKKYKHIVIDYIETSAKTGENIQQTFETLTKGIVKMQTLVKG